MPRTRTPPTRLALTLLAAGCVLACSDPVGSDTPYIVTPITSTDLTGTPGWALTDTLVVEVRDAEGNPVPGAKVHWSLPNGGSLVVQLADADDLTGTADSRGRNYAVWTLGLEEGAQVARAAAGFEEPAAFTASATALHARSVTIGSGYFCAVLTDYRPVCWGNNRSGQLGTGDTLARSTPTSPIGLAAVQDIQASTGGHTCARDMAGDVWCWGNNSHGQAGQGAAQPVQLVPVRVAGAEGASSLTVSPEFGQFTCAVLATGGARCWGRNSSGRLGTGDTVSSSLPRPVVGSDGFVKISTGSDRACAVTTTWEVWCWGDAEHDELSPLPSTIYLTPIQPVPGHLFSEVALNWFANCGLRMGGEALCWGDAFKYSVGSNKYRGPIATPVAAYPAARFAQIVSQGGIFMARTRFGQLVYWGSAGNDHDRAATELDLTIRADQVASGYNLYCIISEAGALYCESSSEWFGEGRNHLQAFPVP